ncbi:hypothetical protein [Streptomyces sp. BRA346]|uniref:hypothetical protein n=1 Tax=Streptomyces sp. BRA346 TaxID=2878199 RepID=UPI0040630E42
MGWPRSGPLALLAPAWREGARVEGQRTAIRGCATAGAGCCTTGTALALDAYAEGGTRAGWDMALLVA